jgi:hypothetical protein
MSNKQVFFSTLLGSLVVNVGFPMVAPCQNALFKERTSDVIYRIEYGQWPIDLQPGWPWKRSLPRACEKR